MTRDLHTSAVFAAVIGTVLCLLGGKMVRRPVETTQRMIDFARGGRPLAKWARPNADTVRTVVRVEGAVLIALGCGLLMLAVYLGSLH